MTIRWLVPLVTLALPVVAQMKDNAQPSLACDDNDGNGRLVRHCEMREQTVPYAGQVTVDGGQNGGVSVKGWSRAEVLVRARVDTSAATDSDARAMAGQVRVDTSAGRVSASGPAGSSDSHWSVSYEVFAPHDANLQVTAHNGGVHISDVRGNIEFSAVNGGLHLARLAGHVKGSTQNGGIHLELGGTRWDGEGLDVSTTNGGVHIGVPTNYSAQLETSTVNGGLRADYAMTVTGKLGKQLSAKLGSGGATVRAVTTNGGVQIGPVSE